EESLQIPVSEGRETFVATRQAIVSLHLEILLGQDRNAEALDVARQARSRVLRLLEPVDRLASLPPDRRRQWERRLTDYHNAAAAVEERARDDWKLPVDQHAPEQAARRAEAEAVTRRLDQAFLVLADPAERQGAKPPPPHAGELILAYHPLATG